MTALGHYPFAWGVKETVLGALDVSEGKIGSGIKKLLFGTVTTNLAAQCAGVSHFCRRHLVKWSVLGGFLAVAIKGAFRCKRGYEERDTEALVKGAAQAALGIAGTACVAIVNPGRLMTRAQDSSFLVLTGAAMAYLGVRDFYAGRYFKGGSEILLGVSAAACCIYYAFYDLLINEAFAVTPQEMQSFLKAHADEIREMCWAKEPVGKWGKLGEGISKMAVFHPEFNGFLVKFAVTPVSGELDTRMHFHNAQAARQLVETGNFSRLVIPGSELIELPEGPIVIEQRFDLVPYGSIPDGREKRAACRQLERFLEKSGIWDVRVSLDHNAGFLKGPGHRIGVFDFD
jgi:hypothetical protein